MKHELVSKKIIVQAINLLILLCLNIYTSTVLAQEYSAKEIIEKADKENKANYEVVKMDMNLIDEQGSIRSRKLIWYSQDNNNSTVSVLKFLAPANIRDVGIMVLENNGDNTIWQYTPATQNIRRIPGEHKQNRFMGTEMIFEDFEGFKINKYTFNTLDKVECNDDRKCYEIEAKPNTLEEIQTSSYLKKIFWIDTQDFFLVKTLLFDKQGKLFKTYIMQDFRLINGFWRPRMATMSNLVDNRKTQMIETSRQINVPFDSYYVSQRYLRSD